MIALTNAFSLSREPFAQDIPIDNLFPLPGLKSFFDRFDYAIRLGAATVITGEVGSTKSTSLRAAANRLHPAQYKIISMVATTGSTLELLRQICLELGAPPVSNSIAKLMKTIRELLSNISAKKQIPLPIIDEAHLMRLDILAQLHTITQLPFDHHSLMPLVLSGQNILIDRLLYYTSKPFASRVVGRTHLQGLQQADMKAYLLHHLRIAGGTRRALLR